MSSCDLCQAFTPRTQKTRHADFMYYTNLLQAGEDIWASDPPSKKGKGRSKSRAGSGPQPKKQKTTAPHSASSPAPSNSNNPLLEEIKTALAVSLERQMDTVRGLISDAVSGLREEISSRPVGPLTDPTVPRSSTQAFGSALNRGDSDRTGASPVSAQVSGTADTPVRTGVEVVSDGPSGSKGRTVVAGPTIRPGDRDLIRSCSEGTRALTAPFSVSSVSGESSELADASVSMASEVASQDDEMEVESVQEPEVISYSSALGQMRERLALILPQVAVKAEVPDPEEFRLPGDAFAPSKRSHAQLRILPSLVEEVMGPLLVGARPRGDLPELDRRYG